MKQQYVYIVDKNDNIISVDENWKIFARENGAPELIDGVIGEPLWKFIGNGLLAGLYKSAVCAVRAKDCDFTLDFRCDSPDTLRYMTLKIVPLPEGQLKFETTLQHSQPRGVARPPNIIARAIDKPLSMCSQCNHVLIDDHWQELEILLDIPAGERLPFQFQFGLCGDCAEYLSAKIAWLDAAQDKHP